MGNNLRAEQCDPPAIHHSLSHDRSTALQSKLKAYLGVLHACDDTIKYNEAAASLIAAAEGGAKLSR